MKYFVKINKTNAYSYIFNSKKVRIIQFVMFSYSIVCLIRISYVTCGEMIEVTSVGTEKKILFCGGARAVMVIVVRNGHGDVSSNPGRD